jgi:hypothetical protein
MKNNLRKLAVLALFALALTGAALADDSAHVVRANIPVDFYVGNKLMPAGEYNLSINVTEHMVTIAQKATGNRTFLLGSSDDSSRDERVVLTFKLVGGDAYALRELQGPDIGLSFAAKAPKTSMKAQNQRAETVTVIAEAR